MATVTVTIRMDPSDHEILEELSERGHSYPATVARKLLSEKLREIKAGWDTEVKNVD